jgi:hypothetical protein
MTSAQAIASLHEWSERMDPVKPWLEAGTVFAAGHMLAAAFDWTAVAGMIIPLVPVIIWRGGLIVAKIRREAREEEIERLKEIIHNSNFRLKEACLAKQKAEADAQALREKIADGEAE